jgi:hypothetical protein
VHSQYWDQDNKVLVNMGSSSPESRRSDGADSSDKTCPPAVIRSWIALRALRTRWNGGESCGFNSEEFAEFDPQRTGGRPG